MSELPADVAETVDALHAAARPTVYRFAGAGSLALHWLHARAGSSRTLLEATDAYAAAALADALGGVTPERAASLATAGALARAARCRGEALGADDPVGLGLAAAIATDRARRGADRAFVAVASSGGVRLWQLALDRDQDRPRHETLASRLALQALAEHAGVQPPALRLGPADALTELPEPLMSAALALLGGHVGHVTRGPDGAFAVDAERPPALLPGAFDPLHDGHRGLARVAARRLGQPVGFELTAVNPDKPPLAPAALVARAAQFAGLTLVLTRRPLFVEKAESLPGTTFVVGIDTAVRILAPRYYGGPDGLRAALSRIRAAGCRFLVAGRVEDGVWQPAEGLTPPAGFEALFEPIPEAAFRVDLSSTELRQRDA